MSFNRNDLAWPEAKPTLLSKNGTANHENHFEELAQAVVAQSLVEISDKGLATLMVKVSNELGHSWKNGSLKCYDEAEDFIRYRKIKFEEVDPYLVTIRKGLKMKPKHNGNLFGEFLTQLMGKPVNEVVEKELNRMLSACNWEPEGGSFEPKEAFKRMKVTISVVKHKTGITFGKSDADICILVHGSQWVKVPFDLWRNFVLDLAYQKGLDSFIETDEDIKRVTYLLFRNLKAV